MNRCLGCMEEFQEGYDLCPYCGYEVGTPPREAYHMMPGTLLLEGRYLIGRVLGFGGFGVTYIGWDRVLERKVAVKEYLPGEFSTRIPGQTQVTAYEGERTEQFGSGLGKFLEEAKMLAKLEAANGVVQIYNSFQENGTAYIIMEYLEGKNLKDYIEQKGKLSVEEAREILHPVITALKDVHAMRILHRDIAPDNIFLTDDGRVKLLDFGASRFATTSHSKSLSVIIKAGYAPVEQYRSRGDQGTWTDVYSLAATFYKMVTGVTPEDAMERVEKEELKKPSKLGIEIPKNTEHAIMNALNIKIEDRTQDVEAFEKELYLEEKVRLRFVRLKKADVGKWPLWSKLAMSAAVLSVLVFAGLLAVGVIDYSRLIPEGFALPEGKTRVPNLVNEDVDAADTLLSDAGLYMQIVDKQYSEYVQQDLVLSQNVGRGKIVNIEQVVEVVVSGGREIVVMQDVCGYYIDNALEVLSSLGLTVELREEYGEYAAGVVMAQSMEAGAQTYRGELVTLTVSKGYDTYIDTEQEVTIPDFTGMTLNQAIAEAAKSGLSLVKVGSRNGKQAPGTILEQSPAAGATGHQGDVIEVVTAAEELPVYMLDAQYKDVDAVIAELESMGLKVCVEYEESGTVAKGKVISQSKEAYVEVTSGSEITLVVSSGTEKMDQIVAQKPQWSDWMESLPDGVSKSDYEIETKTQYRFRDKSTMISDKDSLEGWILYDQTTAKGEFGAWSPWNLDKPAEQANREIREKAQYAYRDKETTESDQASMEGWTQTDNVTYYLDDYGNWSDWSATAVTGSATREAETKTQYRSSTKTTTTSNSKTMSGYTYEARTESVGEWTDWSENPVTASEMESARIEVETQQWERQIQTGTEYNYYHWKYWNSDENMYYYTFSESYATARGGSYYESGWGPEKPYQGTYQGTAGYGTQGGIPWYFKESRAVYSAQPYNVYRSRTVTYTYHFYKWSDWSGWGDAAVTENDSTKVETLTVYRYRDKIPHYKYTYERWTDWTAWGDTPVTGSATREVKTQTIYQYRDKTDVVTYYYYQWGNWSDYRDEKVENSDTREVQERTLYRYRKK